ncbi:hypothetical protein [Sulfurisphaera tokodaii]|uniref:Uncharacterized protein n=1 Tax=Sulfurisphaera tokodaii (strain DSM 16993 / JCM 10545 / NBRC 100140 / 7) TaxID=273063 RepID=Q96ZA8_SULTO|nr:hypothetical protein [Sulfurisphaera tokodaii]BAB67018.1 hypothetical protein STK_19250 [Sulfurisphaera tokodaii str. 7]
MGKSFRERIKKRVNDFYALYLSSIEKNVSRDVSAFLLLCAIEEESKYIMEYLIEKCNDPILRRDFRSRLYKDHLIKYKNYLALSLFLSETSEHDIYTIINNIVNESNNWVKIRKRYLVKVHEAEKEVDEKTLKELEKYYLSSNEIETFISGLNQSESCEILKTLYQFLV